MFNLNWKSPKSFFSTMVIAGLVMTISTPGFAQMAEVPRPNAKGDFTTARVLGNRGTYLQKQWLVVDPDPKGLNCRDGNNRALVKLAYGAVVDSLPRSSNADAIRLFNGQPWLQVKVQLFDVQQRIVERRDTYTCFVRANTKYIAPMNPDTQ